LGLQVTEGVLERHFGTGLWARGMCKSRAWRLPFPRVSAIIVIEIEGSKRNQEKHRDAVWPDRRTCLQTKGVGLAGHGSAPGEPVQMEYCLAQAVMPHNYED